MKTTGNFFCSDPTRQIIQQIDAAIFDFIIFPSFSWSQQYQDEWIKKIVILFGNHDYYFRYIFTWLLNRNKNSLSWESVELLSHKTLPVKIMWRIICAKKFSHICICIKHPVFPRKVLNVEECSWMFGTVIVTWDTRINSRRTVKNISIGMPTGISYCVIGNLDWVIPMKK